MEIIFVTGNQYKLEVARKALEGTKIILLQQKLDTPEIQSLDPKEIASYSAKWVAEKLGKPVVLTDAGYFIEALNDFPGPFVKYFNQWFTSADLIKLMEGKEERTIICRDCLAYCKPGEEPITFIAEARGTIATKPGRKDKFPMNEVLIPEGFDRPQSEIPKEEMIKFWNKNLTIWQDLAKYLKTF